METKANYVVVGIFTLAAICAAFGFVYWSAQGDGGDAATLRVRIPGSASGLGRGSAVLFNGVRVGDVTRVFIDINNPSDAVAEARIDRLTPITRSTQADIGLASLTTGQSNIELTGGRLDEPNLLDEAEEAGVTAQITANPSAVTNLLQTAQDIFGRADSILVEFEGFVTDVRGPLTQTVENVNTFSAALGRNAEGIDTFLASVSALSETATRVAGTLEDTLGAVEGLLAAVDRDQIAAIVANVESTTESLASSARQFDGVIAGVDTAVGSFTELAGSAGGTLSRANALLDTATASVTSLAEDLAGIADGAAGTLTRVDGLLETTTASVAGISEDAAGTLARVDGILETVDTATIRTALTNIEQASTTANAAINDFAEVARNFGARSGDIDQMISDAAELTQRLNQASVRVDGVLQRVDTLLGSDEAEGLMVDAGETLRAFRQVADTLNARMGAITDGLARFSGQGLRDVEALVRDGRRAITRIEQSVTELERNPQRIITGGEGTVRQFDGRARR